MSSNDEALIAQLQEAHGRATKGEWTATKQKGGPGHGFQAQVFGGDGFSICAFDMKRHYREADASAAFCAMAHNALPRLIELAREGLASKEVVDCTVNMVNVLNFQRQAWGGNDAIQRNLSNAELALSTLASATRKEDQDGK